MHIELEILYFRFPLRQRPDVLLYSKYFVFYTNNPAFSEHIITAIIAFTLV